MEMWSVLTIYLCVDTAFVWDIIYRSELNVSMNQSCSDIPVKVFGFVNVCPYKFNKNL